MEIHELRKADYKNGDKIWGWAYTLQSDKEKAGLKQQPVKGILAYRNRDCAEAFDTAKDIRYFIPFSEKTGKPVFSRAVSIYARSYEETKEEAVKAYNARLQEYIDQFQEKINELKLEII